MQPGSLGDPHCALASNWNALAEKVRAVAETGTYCWDSAGDLICWDEIMCGIVGLPAHGARPFAAFLDVVHPDDRERVRAEFRSVIDAHRHLSLTFRIRRPDGRERLLLASGYVECAATGGVSCVVGSATDVTGRLGNLMRDAAELGVLRTVLGNTPDIVALFDREFRHLYVSPTIELITGQPASAFIGKTNEELGMPPENCREWRAVMESVMQTGKPGRLGFAIPDRTGVVRHYESRIVPVFDPHGELASLVSIVSDVSEQASTVHELRQSQERLAAADRFKDVFMSVLAHELRNPLAPIRSALGMLRLTRQEAVIDRACEIIDRQTGQLVNIVDDLLDLARVREGKFGLRRRDMDVLVALKTACEAVEPSFVEKEQAFACDIPDEPLMFAGDPTRIVQVFVNLLCNASKFTARGGHVRVRAVRQDRDIAVTVEDDGIGMDARQLGNLFTLFRQHECVGDRASGLGIGLMLVRQIVEAHGGTVSAGSEGHGKGSVFTVTLPLPS